MPNSDVETVKKEVEYFTEATKMAKGTSIEASALFQKGLSYMTVLWEGRDQNALSCFEEYLRLCPNGDFAEEAQFKQMYIYIGMGQTGKARKLFNQYRFQKKYHDSGYTIKLLQLFKENTGE